MKIGIYGGSFDPPHLGHLNVVLNALNSQDLDKVWVIPCFQQTGKNLTDFWHRFAMCEKLFREIPDVHVLNIEEQLGGESITLRTMQYFIEEEFISNEYEYFLIVGQDTADKIPNWEGGSELLKLVKLRVAPRTNISSTQIRNDISLSYSKCTKSVCGYIYENGLYQ